MLAVFASLVGYALPHPKLTKTVVIEHRNAKRVEHTKRKPVMYRCDSRLCLIESIYMFSRFTE